MPVQQQVAQAPVEGFLLAVARRAVRSGKRRDEQREIHELVPEFIVELVLLKSRRASYRSRYRGAAGMRASPAIVAESGTRVF
ncbi:hypothetical protein LGM59_02705 [Burkholderia metallica]|nr:hypothetical protein [Burkholderia metallica]